MKEEEKTNGQRTRRQDEESHRLDKVAGNCIKHHRHVRRGKRKEFRLSIPTTKTPRRKLKRAQVVNASGHSRAKSPTSLSRGLSNYGRITGEILTKFYSEYLLKSLHFFRTEFSIS